MTYEEIEKQRDIILQIKTKLDKLNPRSAWNRGVIEYAFDFLDELDNEAYSGHLDNDIFSNRKFLEKRLLNGAADWSQYSYGGCSLIYDRDIAMRLCNWTEWKRSKEGERNPNRYETWLDVQVRALNQAAKLVKNAVFD